MMACLEHQGQMLSWTSQIHYTLHFVFILVVFRNLLPDFFQPSHLVIWTSYEILIQSLISWKRNYKQKVNPLDEVFYDGLFEETSQPLLCAFRHRDGVLEGTGRNTSNVWATMRLEASLLISCSDTAAHIGENFVCQGLCTLISLQSLWQPCRWIVVTIVVLQMRELGHKIIHDSMRSYILLDKASRQGQY